MRQTRELGLGSQECWDGPYQNVGWIPRPYPLQLNPTLASPSCPRLTVPPYLAPPLSPLPRRLCASATTAAQCSEEVKVQVDPDFLFQLLNWDYWSVNPLVNDTECVVWETNDTY